MSAEYVILVDCKDNQIGIMEKMDAHRKALLHRAISVFVCNTKGEWILQRRAFGKYHSNGLWTNTCCSHPFPDESSMDAAGRRLMEEMGLKCPLYELFSFSYKEELDNGLTENEFDHVFLGFTDDIPQPNSNEVVDWKYISYSNLLIDIKLHPDRYTVWFKKIFEEANLHISEKLK